MLQRSDGARSHRILLASLIALALVVVGSSVDWHRLSVDGLDGSLNDQVAYVSVARSLADHGTLESSVVYPLLLRQHIRRNSLYMPGFYWVLAAVYKCLGYSAALSRIPSLIGFLLACWLIYWIADTLYRGRAAYYACALFVAFPLSLVYAFTAMMELTLVAAGLASFVIFLRTKGVARFGVAPIALLLPFVFRETGAIVGVVMLAVLAGTTLTGANKEKRVRYGLICALLMVLILAAALYSPLGAERPSLWKANILIGRNFEVVYGDAFATDRLPCQMMDWVVAIRHKFTANLHALVRPSGESAGFFEQSVLWFTLSGIPLGLVLWFRKRDYFALGVGVAVSVLLLALLCLYAVWGYRGVRVLLILQPFVGVLWGVVLERLTRPAGLLVHSVSVILLFVLGTWGATHVIRSEAEVEEQAKTNTEFLESIVQDRELLASPFWLSLDYVNEHYPQKWAFVPSNCETLRLLDERYRIGTLLLLEPESGSSSSAPLNEICGAGLKFAGEREFDGSRFRIYRREQGGN